MHKRTYLILLITFLSISQVFSQNVTIESDSSSNSIGFDMLISPSLVMVQDKFSPTLVGRIGIATNGFRIYLVAENNYYFSTKSDNSRSRNTEMYYGLEWLFRPGVGSSYQNKRIRAKKNMWGGLGVSYCPNPFSELHEKKPIKAYAILDFGGVTIRTAYVWSDFFYPAVGVSFGF